MEKIKKVPYSVYLPPDLHAKLTAIAQKRKASEMVRNAITMIIEGNEAYISGYNKAIKDAAQLVYDCEEAQMVAIKGKDLGSILTHRIEGLEMKK
jgi:predicted transcriptional regulator